MSESSPEKMIDSLAMSILLNHINELRARTGFTTFEYNRNGLRLGLAAIEDEHGELYELWLMNKRALFTPKVIENVKHEALDIAACAMIVYMEASKR